MAPWTIPIKAWEREAEDRAVSKAHQTQDPRRAKPTAPQPPWPLATHNPKPEIAKPIYSQPASQGRFEATQSRFEAHPLKVDLREREASVTDSSWERKREKEREREEKRKKIEEWTLKVRGRKNVRDQNILFLFTTPWTIRLHICNLIVVRMEKNLG